MLIRTDDRPIAFTMDGGSPAARLEPVTLAMAKTQIRFGSTSEDVLIATFIGAGRAYFEEQTSRPTITQTREYALDQAPAQRAIEIPSPPLVSVEHIKYDDANGDEQTFDAANYRAVLSMTAGDEGDPVAIDPYCARGRVELVAGASWPTTSGLARSLRIRYTAGYGATVTDMPPMIQATLYILIAHFFRNRDVVGKSEIGGTGQLPLGAQALIDAFKYTALPTLLPRTCV